MTTLPIPTLSLPKDRLKIIFRFSLWLSFLGVGLPGLFAQGSLTPPGAPAPTMKTLDQIEPRTDVLKLSGDANILFLITNSGSYYLTTNIVGVSGKDGINIKANNVTLDLNGFAVVGVPGSSSGILVAGPRTNVTIRNGSVSGWDGTGVGITASTPRNVVFERLNVSGSGITGIVGYNTVISGCTVIGSGGNGIGATASDIRDCVVNSSVTYGISANDCRVHDCSVNTSGIYGINVAPGTVSGCVVQNSGYSGIFVNAPGSQIIGNTCIGNNTNASVGDAGIFINDSNNRVENNHVTTSGNAGIQVNNSTYVNNVIIKNTVSGNGANNYLGTAGNDFGPIGTAATATSPWANISH